MSAPCFQEQSYCVGGCQCRHKQAVPNTMRSSSVDCIVHFRRKYLKGLLSIPCDGRVPDAPWVSRSMSPLGHAAGLLPKSLTKNVNNEIICAWELDPALN